MNQPRDSTLTTPALPAEVFADCRPRLVMLAYRMLGSLAEAEDVVQDAWLRIVAVNERVESPLSYLRQVVTRLSLDRLKSARRQRETYIGPWLPEPVLADRVESEHPAELADDISFALLLVLERLSPLERAAFLLREVFETEFSEIAIVLDREEATCRQLVKRAREHVAQTHKRYEPNQTLQVDLVQEFFRAAKSGDIAGLRSLLSQDAVLLSDGGGRRRTALLPIHGRDHIARYLTGVHKRWPYQEWVHAESINGQPGYVFRDNRGDLATIAIELSGGATDGASAAPLSIHRIYITKNPDKLASVRARYED